MKSFFFQVLYCGYKSFERWIFEPRGEILTVEMKTVTQYTALIRLPAPLRGQESIPERRADASGLFSDIDHMYGFMWGGGVGVCSHRSHLSLGSSFTGFHNPFPSKASHNIVWHGHININKRDILVHPVIVFYRLVCHHQCFPRLLLIFCCFHWQRLKLPHAFLICM